MPGPYILDTTTTDNYQYLSCPDCTRITIQVSNAAIYIGFGQLTRYFSKGSGTYPAQDEPYLPNVGGLSRKCDEIRVKSYVAGAAARVMVTAQ